MSLAQILSNDITHSLNIPRSDTAVHSTLSSSNNQLTREQLVVLAYNNQAWSQIDYQGGKLVRINRDLIFQILIIENVSISKQQQLDNLQIKFDPKSIRMDTLKNSKLPTRPKLISQINVDDDNDNDDFNSNIANGSSSSSSNEYSSTGNTNQMSGYASKFNGNSVSTFKLTIQGTNGDIFNAINKDSLPWNSCSLGAKIILKKGTIFINDNTFMFTKDQIIFLGGLIKDWNQDKDCKMLDLLKYKLDRDHEVNKGKRNKLKRKIDLIL